MNRHDSDSSAALMLPILAAAAIGAGLALLFAPKSGQALRSDLGDSSDAVRAAVADRYQALAARAGVELDDLRATVAAATEALESRAQAVVQSASRTVRRQTGA